MSDTDKAVSIPELLDESAGEVLGLGLSDSSCTLFAEVSGKAG